MKKRYYCNCVSWPKDDVQSLIGMIDRAIDITRRTFLKHIERQDLDELAREMGYTKHPRQGLTLAGDWAVSYHRSTLNGQRVYFMRHSAIEYVFS